MNSNSKKQTEVGQTVASLFSEFQIIKKYHELGYIKEKDLQRIEDYMKVEILEACSIDFLRPKEQIFTRIK